MELCEDHQGAQLVSLCIDKTCKEKNRNCCIKCLSLRNKHNKHDTIEYTEGTKIIEKHYEEDVKQEKFFDDLNMKVHTEVVDRIAQLKQQYIDYANMVEKTVLQKLTQKFHPNELVRKYHERHLMTHEPQDIDSLIDLFMADKLEYPMDSMEQLKGQINQFMERLNQIRDVAIKSTIDAGLYPKPEPVVQPQPQPQQQQEALQEQNQGANQPVNQPTQEQQQQPENQPAQTQPNPKPQEEEKKQQKSVNAIDAEVTQPNLSQVPQEQNKKPNQPVNQPTQEQQQQPQSQQAQTQPKPKPQEEEKKQQSIDEKMAVDLSDLDKKHEYYERTTKKWRQVYQTLIQKGANGGRGFCGQKTNYGYWYGGGGGYCGTSHGTEQKYNGTCWFYCCQECWKLGEGNVDK